MRQVRATLEKLEPAPATLLLAVSGGADSLALLRLLHALYPPKTADHPEEKPAGYRLVVAHFDHSLRPESAEDAAFVAELCQRLQLPCWLERQPVERIARLRGWNLEDAARRLRYGFLFRCAQAQGAQAVITAHTQDDQAETLLLQLLRGAAQLQGIAPRRGKLLRPLLEVAKSSLLAYLQSLNQEHREDSSNQDSQRSRAWLRQQVMPVLEARYPQYRRQFSQLATQQRDQQAFLEHQASLRFPALQGDKAHSLRTQALARQHPALQRQLLRQLCHSQRLPYDYAHLETLRQHLEDKHPYQLSMAKGYQARIGQGLLQLLEPVNNSANNSANKPVDLETLPASIDPDKLRLYPEWCAQLRYRQRLAGDRIRLAAGEKKLSRLLIERKVPRAQRDSLQVLAAGSQVLWVEAIATDVRLARQGWLEHSDDPDVRWMRLALEQAKQAAAQGEVPVGAVVVMPSANPEQIHSQQSQQHMELVALAHNRSEASCDPSAHAEILALRQLASQRQDWRLASSTLYVTLEPCVMCFGAVLQAQVARVVYGADNIREGALTRGDVMLGSHGVQLRAGVLAAESQALLQGFFRARRTKS